MSAESLGLHGVPRNGLPDEVALAIRSIDLVAARNGLVHLLELEVFDLAERFSSPLYGGAACPCVDDIFAGITAAPPWRLEKRHES